MANNDLLRARLDYLKMPFYDIARLVAPPTSTTADNIVTRLERATKSDRAAALFIRILVRDLYARKLRLQAQNSRLEWKRYEKSPTRPAVEECATTSPFGVKVSVFKQERNQSWEIRLAHEPELHADPPVSHGYNHLEDARENALLYAELAYEQLLVSQERSRRSEAL